METNPFSLEGKTILVTGASSGIGKSIAILCSKMGAKVYITARREEKLKETLNEMQGLNKYIVADITKQEGINTLVEQLPKLDGVVHCAGVGSRQLCKQITLEELHHVLEANFIGPIMLQTTILSRKKLTNMVQ